MFLEAVQDGEDLDMAIDIVSAEWDLAPHIDK